MYISILSILLLTPAHSLAFPLSAFKPTMGLSLSTAPCIPPYAPMALFFTSHAPIHPHRMARPDVSFEHLTIQCEPYSSMLTCRPNIGLRHLLRPPIYSTGIPPPLFEMRFPIFAFLTPIPLMITCASSVACVILICRPLLRTSSRRVRQHVSFWDILLIIRDIVVSTSPRVRLLFLDTLCLMSPPFPSLARLIHPPPAPLISYSVTTWILHPCLLIMQLVALLRMLHLP